MGHIYVDGRRVTRTFWESKQEIYAQQAAAFEHVPEQRSEDGRRYKTCPVCHVPAWRRHNGYRVWWSHQHADGSWCNGLPQTPSKIIWLPKEEEEQCPSNS